MNAASSREAPVTLDVSDLPTYAFGERCAPFWGGVLLACIEGTAMAILFATYFYLRGNFAEWPPSARYPLVPGALSTAVLVASLLPMWRTGVAARAMDLARTRRWQIIALGFGLVGLGLRAWELHALAFRWDENAYASIVWVALGFHTFDFVAEILETIVLTAVLLRGRLEPKHYEDVDTNAFFWAFLVLFWLPFAGVILADGAVR